MGAGGGSSHRALKCHSAQWNRPPPQKNCKLFLNASCMQSTLRVGGLGGPLPTHSPASGALGWSSPWLRELSKLAMAVPRPLSLPSPLSPSCLVSCRLPGGATCRGLCVGLWVGWTLLPPPPPPQPIDEPGGSNFPGDLPCGWRGGPQCVHLSAPPPRAEPDGRPGHQPISCKGRLVAPLAALGLRAVGPPGGHLGPDGRERSAAVVVSL